MRQHIWEHNLNTSDSLYGNALYMCAGCDLSVYIYKDYRSEMQINYYWDPVDGMTGFLATHEHNIDQNCGEYKLRKLLR